MASRKSIRAEKIRERGENVDPASLLAAEEAHPSSGFLTHRQFLHPLCKASPANPFFFSAVRLNYFAPPDFESLSLKPSGFRLDGREAAISIIPRPPGSSRTRIRPHPAAHGKRSSKKTRKKWKNTSRRTGMR